MIPARTRLLCSLTLGVLLLAGCAPKSGTPVPVSGKVYYKGTPLQSGLIVFTPDAAKGEIPIVYVQLKAGATATTEELLARCRERVQERAAVPVEVIIAAQIPLTAIGKINKPALRADAMLRVARRQADAIVSNSARFLVSVDESGTRPRVKLTLDAPEGDAPALKGKLEAALGRFEFETSIDFAPVNRANCADSRETDGRGV